MVFGVQHPDGRKLHSCFDIRRLKPQKITSHEDYSVRDTVLNWRLSFKDFFRLVDKGIPTLWSGAERSGAERSGAERSTAEYLSLSYTHSYTQYAHTLIPIYSISPLSSPLRRIRAGYLHLCPNRQTPRADVER